MDFVVFLYMNFCVVFLEYENGRIGEKLQPLSKEGFFTELGRARCGTAEKGSLKAEDFVNGSVKGWQCSFSFVCFSIPSHSLEG